MSHGTLHSRLLAVRQWTSAGLSEGLAITRYARESLQPWKDLAGEGSPILFVHGHHSLAAGFRPMARFLHAQTGRPAIATSWTDHKNSLELHAQRMVEQMQKKGACQRPGTVEPCPLTIVAHSRGGLVSALFCARWAQEHGFQVDRLITMGTPWWGTRWAVLGKKVGYPGSAPLQLAIDSPVLAEIRDWASSGSAPRICCIGTPHDQIILPASGAYLPHTTNCTISGIGHVGLLFDRKVMKQVLEWL